MMNNYNNNICVYIFFIAFIIMLTVLRETNGDCAWKDNDRSSVMCNMKNIDQSNIVDLEVAIGCTRLMINCDHTLLYESIIPAEFFHKHTSLEELYIDGCKILHLQNDTFNPLHQLRVLHVNTKNSIWGQSNVFDIEIGAFNGLTSVHTLNLNDNNIRMITGNALCAMKSLRTITLASNRIRSTDDIGFIACPNANFNELQSIDLSNNEIITIKHGWMKSDLRAVHTLNLQQNNISKIETGSFDILPGLKKLNLSFNHLETLPTGLFNQCQHLEEIDLQNNKLYQLPFDIFAQLTQLIVLNLSNNQLSSHYIDSSIFSHLKRLVVLNLANNALTRIDSATFSELNFLQNLDLKNNSIGFVDDKTFAPLTNLHTLNLSGNRLHIVGNGLFNGLYVLSKLVLNNNLITVIDANAFVNCSSLKELDLSSNQLSDIPVAITSLHMLKSLDLGENRISELGNDSFRNLNQLTGLRLADNLISNITCGILYDLPKLSVLNLAKNKIISIERGSFDQNQVIEAIRLDKNLLTDINGIFSTLNSLLWLNLSENQLNWFDYAFIPMNLKWLDIHGNYIEALGNYYKLQNEITVKTLDASHNRITEINPTSVPNSIELFFVNNNLIRNVYPNTFIDKINLTRVDLYSNAITKLHLHAIRIAPILLKKHVPEFYLGGNPFECDCSMGWLRHRNTDTSIYQQQHPKIMDYDTIECLVPHKRNAPVRFVSTLNHQDFLCRYENICPPTCHCCESKSCYCNIKCPTNCSCFHDQTGIINKINCGQQNSYYLPESIPNDATQLYIDGNHYLELHNYAFGGQKKLKSLYANNSNIITIQPHSFTGLSSLQKLHLNDNKLTALYGYEFNQLHNLRELYLQNNLLTYIENGTFSLLNFLHILHLDGNRIATLSTWQMQSVHLQNIKSLTLGNNLWNCGCDFLQEFIIFVYESDVNVRDINELYCVEGEQKRSITINSTAACKEYDRVILPEGIPHGYIPLLGFALTILFVLAILVAIFTVKEQLCCTYTSLEKQGFGKMTYDALILAAKDDADFVSSHIVSEIKQSKPSMRFGMQHKNISSSSIVTAANRSKKIVIYLSNSFLQTEWIQGDIRSTIANSWMPGRIIIIQTPNLQFASNLDRELINNVGKGVILLKTWEIDFSLKLCYALESHPSHLTVSNSQQSTNSHAGIWTSSNNSNVIGDGGGDDANIPYLYDETIFGQSHSYYSSPMAESAFSDDSPCMPQKLTNNHVYAGIDSDYGSVTNEDSIVSVHRPVVPLANNNNNLTNPSETNFTNNNFHTDINGFLV